MASSSLMLHSTLCVILTLVLPSLQQTSPIVMGPVDTTTAVGNDAVFYCKVRPARNVLVYWVEDRSLGIGPNVNKNSAYPQYEIFGDALLGYYNFRITNVTVEDSGKRYDCVVSDQETESNYESGALLTVVNDARPPNSSSPICQMVPSNEFTLDEGDPLPNYRCDIQGGTPLGELLWSSMRADGSVVDVSADVLVDGDSVEAILSRYTVGPEDHESQMACSVSHPSLPASHPSLPANRSCYVPSTGKILVRHFPQIDFGPEINIRYLESTTASVRCSASAYPPISPTIPELKFSNPEKMIEITRQETGVIEATIEVSQSDVGQHINCSATNVKGTTTVMLEIKLQRALLGWLLITVLIAAIVLLLFISLCCCYCFCNGCKSEKKNEDQPDLADSKAAGYDVNGSRAVSVYQPNGHTNDTALYPMDHVDDGSFDTIPLDVFTPQPANLVNDNETGEVNDGYMTPNADERFPPMIEDEHLMGEKRISSFKPDENGDLPPPPPPPPPPLDLDYPTPIPKVEDN